MTDIIALDITPAEVQAGQISPEHLAAATRALAGGRRGCLE